jgi:hypothetical protein
MPPVHWEKSRLTRLPFFKDKLDAFFDFFRLSAENISGISLESKTYGFPRMEMSVPNSSGDMDFSSGHCDTTLFRF